MNSCGAVAGFSVVKTFHPDADFGEFYDSINPDPETGTSDLLLIKSLRKFGIKCGWSNEIPNFRYIRTCIDGKALLLAGIYLGDDIHHWVVIYGYGINPGKSVFLASCSGFFRPNRVRWEEFRKAHVQSIGGDTLQSSLPPWETKESIAGLRPWCRCQRHQSHSTGVKLPWVSASTATSKSPTSGGLRLRRSMCPSHQ